jgi:hypothetical protein
MNQTYISHQIVNLMPGHIYWKDIHGVYLGYNNLFSETVSNSRSIIHINGKTDSELFGEYADKIIENDKHNLSNIRNRRILCKTKENLKI